MSKRHEKAHQVSLDELMTFNALVNQQCDCVHPKRGLFRAATEHLPGLDALITADAHGACKRKASWLVTQLNHAGQSVPLYLCTKCATDLEAHKLPRGVEPLE